jgi:hypothetical protein
LRFVVTVALLVGHSRNYGATIGQHAFNQQIVIAADDWIIHHCGDFFRP